MLLDTSSLTKIKQLEKEIKELKEQLNKKNEDIFSEFKSKIEENLGTHCQFYIYQYIK